MAHVRPPGPDQDLFDLVLYRQLEAENFSPDALNRGYGRAFVGYAIRVLSEWLANGQIFHKCRSAGRPLGPTPYAWSSDDRDELVYETVARAIALLRQDTRRGRGWSPEGGASPHTYFVSICVRTFPNVYRLYQREQVRLRWVNLTSEPPEPLPHHPVTDPLDVVVTRETTRDALKKLRLDVAIVFVMYSLGYSHGDIGRAVGRSSRAVESILRRYRRNQPDDPDN